MPILKVTNGGPMKINAIKALREFATCGLKEAKDAIEGTSLMAVPESQVLNLEREFLEMGVQWEWVGNVSGFRQLLDAAIAWKMQQPRPTITSEADRALHSLVGTLQRKYAPDTIEPRTVWDRLAEDDD